MNKLLKTLCPLLALLTGCIALLGDEVAVRGARASELNCKPWKATPPEYDGVYVLRKSDGPRETIIMSSFSASPDIYQISVCIVSREDGALQPEYRILGNYLVDSESGNLKRSEDEPVDIQMIMLPDPTDPAKQTHGTRVGDIVYKKIY